MNPSLSPEGKISSVKPLPDFIRALLANCPRAGSGVNRWLFCTARQLHAHFDEVTIANLLESNVAECGRTVPRLEIERAVTNSKAGAWQPIQPGRPVTAATVNTWPAINESQRAAILRDGIALADLWEFSPVRFDDCNGRTEEIIDQLFPGNPLLCCGKSKSDFDTKPRADWRGQLESLALIVPSPMSAGSGITKEGRESKHTLNNTGPRRFLVVEFDSGTFDQHAALLWHLAGYGPLVLCTSSGGKSLHGWFFCEGMDDEKLKKFMRYGVSIGADRATWTRSQFVRMPDGTRENGRPQMVFYFNPALIR